MELLWNPPKEKVDEVPPPLVSYLKGRRDSFALLGASICRNLDWVLNSRRHIPLIPGASRESLEDLSGLGELRQSIYVYGVRDLGGSRADSETEYKNLKDEIKELVDLFEPRLTDVEVDIVDSQGNVVEKLQPGITGTLHFQIRALMVAEPEPIRTWFRVEGSPISGGYKVKEGN